MENKKKEYLAPTVEVKAVEIESSICGGSVEITNKHEGSIGIETQQTNQTFDAGSQTTGGNNANGWDYTSSGN